MLSDEPSSTDAASRTLHPNVYGASAAYAHSDISDRPILMEDIENYQIDDLEETSGGAGVLYDINNYDVDETEAGPTTAQPTAPSNNISSGPNTDSSVGTGTNASSLTSQTVNSVTPNTADVACLNSTSSARIPALGSKGMVERIFGKLRNNERNSK